MFGDYNSYPWITIIPLLLVCLAAWLVTRFIARRGQQYMQGKYAQIKDSLPIGKDKNIIILEAGNKYYLVGVTNQSMQLLSEIEKGELVPVKGQIDGEENNQSLRGALLRFVEQARGMKNAPAELQKAQKAAKAAQQGDEERGGVEGVEYEEAPLSHDESGKDEYAAGAHKHDNKRLRFAPKAARRDDMLGGDGVTIIGTIPIPEEPENEFERQLYDAEKNYDAGGVYVDVSPAVGITNTFLDDSGSKTANAEEIVPARKGLFARLQKKEATNQREEDDIDRMLLSIGQRTQMLREKRFKDKEDDID